MVIPHTRQRYETIGDYTTDEVHGKTILVSDLGDNAFHTLVAIHELIESTLVDAAGIYDEDITAFDIAYEEARDGGGTVINDHTDIYRKRYNCDCLITYDSEPGDDVHAPYHNQHRLATSVEKMVARQIGVDWKLYENANLAVLAVPLANK